MNHRWMTFAASLAALFIAGGPRAESLDEVGAGLVRIPSIQADLGVTQDQVENAQLRGIKAILRVMAVAKLAASAPQNSEGMLEVKWDSTSFGLGLADLTADQKPRLRQLAFQLRPCDALRTAEGEVALGLTSDQRSRLAALGAPNDAVPTKEVDRIFASKVAKPLAGLFESADEDDFDAKAALARIDKALDDLFREIEKLSRDLRAQFEKSLRERNGKALDILTDSQKQRLKELSGKPFRA